MFPRFPNPTTIGCLSVLILMAACSSPTGPKPDTIPAMSEDSLLQRPRNIDEFLGARRPMVIAHRGFSGKAPENTLTAVRMAMELGADMVEIDVTLSSDGVAIVLHDDTLDRTTDGTGKAQETLWADLQALDAGSWFHRRFAGEPVPSLTQMLDLVKDQILINIEIKTEAVGESALGGIEEKIAEAVRERHMVNQVIVSSFNPLALLHLHQVAPEIRSASLYNRQLHQALLPSEITRQVHASAFNVSQAYLNTSMLEDARANGLPVSVYTVNWTWRMSRLIHRGVDAIFTDRPDRMLRLVEKQVRREARR